MFVGHAGIALAAKRRVPQVSLGWLLVAAFWADILWPLLLIAGIERVRIDPGNTAFTPFAFDSYPWSHSLVMDLGWGLLGGALTFWIRRDWAAALMIGALVVSHWVLDLPVHRADLPLWPGASSPRLGLGLWNSVAGTFLVEGLIFAAGVAIYLRSTRARDRVGTWGLWLLLGFLAAAWATGPFSPPPPSVPALAWVSLSAGPLLGLWAAWVDAHRTAIGASASQRTKGEEKGTR